MRISGEGQSFSLFLSVCLLASTTIFAQPTVGLLKNDTPQDGFVLFGANPSETTYLINNDGLVVNLWTSSYTPGMMAGYLLENGHLMRAGNLDTVHANFSGQAGIGGIIEEYDWDGNLVWEFLYSTADRLTHHDFEPFPDGNVLLAAWEYMPAAEAIQAGKNPALVSGGLLIDCIIEVHPTAPAAGEVVWEWCARDHLVQDFDPSKDNFGVVADHQELIDFNFGGGGKDWTHFNGVDYHAGFDQIVVSAHGLDEIWIIDHGTTTAEAAGHSGGTYGRGGDLLYRWGNPLAYRRGSAEDQKLFGQHDPQWIAAGRPGAGNILIFNNGNGRPEGAYSSVDEIVPPVEPDGSYPAIEPGQPFGPEDAIWSYVADPPGSFYSANISGAERQANGNTLVCEGADGHFFEVGSDAGEGMVWEYINPDTRTGIEQQGTAPRNHPVFKIRRYPPGFPGFEGRILTPGDPIEGFIRPYPVPSDSLFATRITPDGMTIDVEWDAFSCPSHDYNLIYGELQELPAYALSGAECGVGVSGGYLWSAAPAADLFFMVVGTDDLDVYESSWGTSSDGAERFSTKASFLCGSTTKVVTSVCP